MHHDENVNVNAYCRCVGVDFLFFVIRAPGGGFGLIRPWFAIAMDGGFFVNITGEVEKSLEESGIREGLCLVNAMHITASVFINDDEPGLHSDYKKWLEELAPHEPLSRYRHNLT